MTSQLNVDTIVDKAGSGGTNVKIANTSVAVAEGGSATTNTVQGLCKVWARTNMSTAANTDSLNISSITDEGTGHFTITINNDMGNANYTVTDAADNVSSNDNVANQAESHATGSYVILHRENGSQVDTTSFGHSAHGDLA